ncbi:MAG: hypothetical protein WCO68_02340 [Verrucomicrobiota bacterium]
MKTPHISQKTQASTLIVTLAMIVMLFTLAWAAFDFSFFTGRNSKRINTRQQAMEVGDSALELLFAQFKDGFNSYGGSLGNLCPDRAYFQTYLKGSTPLRVPTGAAFPELAQYFPNVANFASARLDQAPTQVFTTYAIEPLDTTGAVATNGTCVGVTTNSPSGIREGKAFRYLATVVVTLPAPGGQTVTAQLSRMFEYQVKSFLNYAIFANSYLEIHPGPNMTINGPVHTNAGLYVGAASGTCTFTDSVEGVQLPTTSGSSSSKYSGIFQGRMVSGSNNSVGTDPAHSGTGTAPAGNGWVNRNANASPVTPLDISQSTLIQSTSPTLKDQWGNLLPYDTNPNNDSYHEIIEPAVFPLTTYPDPFSPGDARTSGSSPFDYNNLQTLRLSNIADYIITLDNATHDVRQPPTITITDSTGATVNTNSDLYKAFVTGLTKSGTTYKVLTTGSSFVDAREADSHGNANMQVTNVDVGMLKGAVDVGAIPASSDSGLGIIVNDVRPTQAYVPAVTHNVVTTSTQGQTVTSSTTVVVDSPAVPKTEPAVRLQNGYVLPSGGLTIVSQNPVYVQGDYNTGGSANTIGSLPISNKNTGSWNPASPDPTTVPNANGLITVSGTSYYWQPAAIVADAINVLSNGWLDSKAGTQPTAKATTINAAFIAGNVPTTNSNYSGGVENYPRFLENWSGVRFNYVGSMVILYASQQATGVWGTGVYSAPTRNWAYDNNFMNFGVPLLASGGSGPGGMGGGGSRKTIAGGGAKMYFRKQWISRTVQ